MNTLSALGEEAIASALGGTGLKLRIGPVTSLIRSPLKGLPKDIHHIYGDYSVIAEGDFAHQSVGLFYSSFFRRFIRPKILVSSEYPSPLVPVPEDIAFVAMEMAVNWQMAMVRHSHLIFHASSVADGQGRSVIMPGASGSGKSTLAAGLGYDGWRFMGDEFVLLDMEKGLQTPYARPISLKNESIAAMKAILPEERFSRLIPNTFKGDVTYLKPPAEAVTNLSAAKPSVIVFPTFATDAKAELLECPAVEALTRMVSASVNYWKLGRPAFDCLTDLCAQVPAYHMSFSSQAEGAALIGDVFERLERQR